MSRRPGLAGRLSGAWRSAGSGPLGVRSFRLLAGGQFASTIGDFCYAVALPWLVLSTHGGTVLLGTVLACYGVPRTGLIPVGGVLADKVGPRTLMLTADVARGVLVAGLAVLAARHAGPRDGSDDALRLRHLSALGGGSRGARAASRAGAVPPIAGGLVAAAILFGLTQREFREFGAVQAASAPKAASGSRK